MSNVITPAPDIRRTFLLSKADALRLFEISQALGSGSQAECDPVYRDRINGFWLDAGERRGFTWNTVQDLVWTGANGLAIDAVTADLIGGAAFTAWPVEPAAKAPADRDAAAYLVQVVDRLKVEQDARTGHLEWEDEEITKAYLAGRAAGMAQANGGIVDDALTLLKAMAHAKNISLVTMRQSAVFCDEAKRLVEHPDAAKLTHSALAEARADVKTALMSGWGYAIKSVLTVIQRAEGENGVGVPLARVTWRVEALSPPEDIDEWAGMLRGVLPELDKLRDLARPSGAHWSNAELVRWAVQSIKAGRERPGATGIPQGKPEAWTTRSATGEVRGSDCDEALPAATLRTIEEAARSGLIPGMTGATLAQARRDAKRGKVERFDRKPPCEGGEC